MTASADENYACIVSSYNSPSEAYEALKVHYKFAGGDEIGWLYGQLAVSTLRHSKCPSMLCQRMLKIRALLSSLGEAITDANFEI